MRETILHGSARRLQGPHSLRVLSSTQCGENYELNYRLPVGQIRSGTTQSFKPVSQVRSHRIRVMISEKLLERQRTNTGNPVLNGHYQKDKNWFSRPIIA